MADAVPIVGQSYAWLCLPDMPANADLIEWEEECGYYPTARFDYTWTRCTPTNAGLTDGRVCVMRARAWKIDNLDDFTCHVVRSWGGYSPPYFFLPRQNVPEPPFSLLLVAGLVGLVILRRFTR